jgi:predicted RNase H-like nuclease
LIRCIGIDLAWSERNASGAFGLEVADGTAREVGWRRGLKCDDEIIAFIAEVAGNRPALVAIDGPIAVPNESGARHCDREITRVFGRFQAGAHPANRRALRRYGGLRVERLAKRVVAELGYAHDPHIPRQTDTRQMLEVYPHPGMVALFGLEKTLKYKRGRIARRRHELNRLQSHLLALAESTPALQLSERWRRDIAGLRGHAFKRYEDLLDSLFCAYTAAYCWHFGPSHYVVFGTVKAGHILVPMPPDQRLRFGLATCHRSAAELTA